MSPSESPQPIADIIAYLFSRRDAILNNWRTTCEEDPILGKVSTLSREEFNNLLPIVLDILEQRLMGKEPGADAGQTAMAHGVHRWQKAFALRETLRELNHLAGVLYGELKLFQQLFPQRDTTALLEVHRQIVELMTETIEGSVVKYDELQRLEAASRSASLQRALDHMNELSKQRSDLLRTSSHDLRSRFGVISGAAQLLQLDGLSEEQRQQHLEMLGRNLGNVREMLHNLMDLSRLEAGEDALQIQKVDVGGLIRELTQSAQPLAQERRLVLQADGPESLEVDTDPIKLQRIIQNLLLNALMYTKATEGRSGIISVSWSREGDFRWVLSVQDSGPGLPDTLTGVLAEQLRPTVEPTSSLAPEQAQPVPVSPVREPKIPDSNELIQLTNVSAKGEGVGLQIVKRLSELLEANLEVETLQGRGTLFRLRFANTLAPAGNLTTR